MYIKSQDRGTADHGWLKSRFTFSFAHYQGIDEWKNIRVLNDDWIKDGEGFGMHPHANYDIVSIVWKGNLLHKDSMGNDDEITSGQIQVMSAGTGVFHSEHAKGDTEIFQMWFKPKAENTEPWYKKVNYEINGLTEVVDLPSVKIFLTDKDAKLEGDVFTMVVTGKATVNGQELQERDALGTQNPEVKVEGKVLMVQMKS